jgi:branched-chain amino acid aminotransferase
VTGGGIIPPLPRPEIAQWEVTPGAISEQLMADYTAEVQPKGKAAAA